MSARAEDRRARRLAQVEFERPLLVEAGAGTGKTATLVARVLAWCLEPGWRRAEAALRDEPGDAFAAPRSEAERIAVRVLRRVVAITFTEAAAAEMAERIGRGFATVAAGGAPVGFEMPAEPAPPVLAERARALLGAADQLQVRTIHAFCRRLLAEHPFEAGLHPQMTVDADGTQVEEIVRESVESALVAAYGERPDPAFLTLAERGVGPTRLAAALAELVAGGIAAEGLAADPFAAENRRRLAARLEAAAREVHEALAGRLAGAGRAKNALAIEEGTARLLERLREDRESAGAAEVATLQALLAEHLGDNLLGHLKKWSKGTLNQIEAERLGPVAGRLAPAGAALEALARHLGRLDPELLGAARSALAGLLARVRGEMRRRGVVSFTDLLRGARDLVEADAALRAQLRRGIDQLLVDEFQDTDRLQSDLVRRLALEGPAGERPGLFVVGDPKQSIYGWRSADLAAYEAFAEALDAAGGERLSLVENFRSVPAILDEVERAVAPVMRRRAGLQPAFERLLPCERLAADPGFARRPRAPVEHWVSWCRADDGGPEARTSARDAARLEARAVAADLLALHRHEGLAWRDAALLLRSSSDLETYLAALRAAGVPFAVSRDRQYYRRREIADAAALVRAVLAPEDHLALVAFLRSSAVGVPDAALVPLWSRRLPRAMTELTGPDPDRLAALRRLVEEAAAELAAEVSPGVPGLERVAGWELSLVHAIEALAALRRSFEHDPADRFVEHLRRWLLFEVTEAGRYLGAYRAANLERFFTELLTTLEEMGGDRHRVLRGLRHRIRRGFEAEEAPPREVGRDAVQVMTIHKAKGLQFRHVYLLQMHKESRPLGVPDVEVGELEGGLEYRLFGAATPGLDRWQAGRDAVESAERVRLLYVAMTRAEERLVMVADRRLEGEPAAPEVAASHADLLGHRRGEAPEREELEEAWRAGEARRYRGEVAWYLPALDRLDLEPLEAPAAAAPPTASALEAAQRELAALRERAAERQARPFRQAPSKLEEAPLDDTLLDAGDPAERRAARRTAGRAASEGIDAERRAALLAGTAVHRLLEDFDFEAEDPREELARQGRRLPALLAALGERADLEAAGRRAEALWERFAGGGLFERFAALRGRVVARELPLLLPPDGNGDGDSGAVGFLAGSVDLVYRDGEGRLVIADFKTDRAAAGDDLEQKARRYAAQGRAYVRALEEALALDAPPRFELWYLETDRVVVPPPAGDLRPPNEG